MQRDCATYKELADYLQLSEKTMLNIWREYPHFFVTAKSRATNSVKAARFNIDTVLEYLESLTPQGTTVEKHSGNQKKRRCNRLQGVLPLQGKAILEAVPAVGKGNGVASGGKEKCPRTTRQTKAFDVFRGVQCLSD